LTKQPGYYNILDFKPDGIIKSSEDAAPYATLLYLKIHLILHSAADYKGFSVMLQFYGVNNVHAIPGMKRIIITADRLLDPNMQMVLV